MFDICSPFSSLHHGFDWMWTPMDLINLNDSMTMYSFKPWKDQILHYFLILPIFLILSLSFYCFWVVLSTRHVWRFLLPAAYWPRVCCGHALALAPLNLLAAIAAYEHLSATKKETYYFNIFQQSLGSKRDKVSRYFKMFAVSKRFNSTSMYQYSSTTAVVCCQTCCTVLRSTHEMAGTYWKTMETHIVLDCAPTTEAGHSRSEASSCASAALWASSCSCTVRCAQTAMLYYTNQTCIYIYDYICILYMYLPLISLITKLLYTRIIHTNLQSPKNNQDIANLAFAAQS